MNKYLKVLTLSISIQSCEIPRAVNKDFVTKKTMYLYDVSYAKNKKYPYSLWKFKMSGRDNLHTMISTVPRNTTLKIEEEYFDRSFTDIDVMRMNGILILRGSKYYFESSWSEQEYKDYIREIKR